jgi:hypothetical protein
MGSEPITATRARARRLDHLEPIPATTGGADAGRELEHIEVDQ